MNTRNSRLVKIVLILVCLFELGAVRVNAQTDPLRDVGIYPFTSQLPVEQGFINAVNGDLHLEIPLGSFPQRGGRQVDVVLEYDSNIWTQLPCCVWEPQNVPSTKYWHNSPLDNAFTGGWRLIVSADPGMTFYNQKAVYTCRTDGLTEWAQNNKFSWRDPKGATHTWGLQTVEGFQTQCGDFRSHDVPNADGLAPDGSGYHLFVTGFTAMKVVGPDGTVVSGLPSTIAEDSNGNYFSQDTNTNAIDTLGRTPITTSINGNTITFAVLNSRGGTSTYTATIATNHVATNFKVGNYTEYPGVADLGTITVITSLALPDGTSYSFGYDFGTTPGHYGDLTSMTLPTGSQITYTYANFIDAMYYIPGPHMSRMVKTRTTPNGQWTYTPQVINSCSAQLQSTCSQKLTVLKPSGDNVVITSSVYPTFSAAVQMDYYNGSVVPANLLATQTQAFDSAYSEKTAETTTLPLPNGTSVNRTTQYIYDNTANIGHLLTKQEWNFYTGSLPAAADRTTKYTYLTGTAYTNANIIAPFASVTVTDKNNVTVAQTVNCYDYAGGCGGSSFASVGGVFHHDDTNYGPGNTVRGDLTQIQKLISGTTYLTTSSKYDTTGQVTSSADANSNLTTYSYADSFYNDAGDSVNPSAYTPPTPTNAYVKTITQGSLGSTFGYFWGTGKKALSTDPNLNTTYYHFFDLMGRPTSTKLPNGGWTYSSYPSGSETQTDTGTGITSSTETTNCPATSGGCRHDETLLDGVGRLSSRVLVSDPDGQITVATTYDGNGRVHTVSNPYRAPTETTYGLETPTYDGLDRITQMTRPDNSIAKTYYGSSVSTGGGAASQLCPSATYGLGYPVLKVDEAGNKRQTWIDGFGRVIEADEPDSTGSLTAGTCYSYDLNNNLTTVVQGTRTRNFSYDNLSRLTYSSNPESGVVNFYYTNSSGGLCSGDPTAVCRRTDARGITTTYGYDSLNRITSKTYTDSTSTVSYYYDQSSYNGLTITNGIGRRTGMSDASGQSAWSYDSTGIVSSLRRTIAGKGNTATYSSNLDGSLSNLTYFSGTQIAYTYSGSQRPLTARDPYPINFVKAAQYAPWGALTSAAFGAYDTGFTGTVTTNSYNNRLQPAVLSAASPSMTVLSLSYNFNQGTPQAPKNNGSVITIQNNRDATRTQGFTYDTLDRISSAQTSNSNLWGDTYIIDSYGNLTNMNPIAGKGGQSFQEGGMINAKNQFNDRSYDASGNAIKDDLNHTLTYDAENRITSAGGDNYIYDGDGNRSEKCIPNASSPTTCSNATNGTLYWYDSGGNVINESDLNTSVWKRFVFFNGKRVARRDSDTGNVYYFFSDHLGSVGVITDALGQNIVNESDYYPYGGERVVASALADEHYKFTGKEWDAESLLNDFGARHYSSAMGRFMQPDPMGGHFEDPQTLNRYVYVRNNPLNLTDPTGLDFYLQCNNTDHENCIQVQIDPNNQKKTWVQAGEDGSATIVTSNSIRSGENSATVTESGVQINSTSHGIYFDNPASHTTDASGNQVNTNPINLAGGGALRDFSFNVNGNCSGTCLSSGSWTYNGSLNAARVLLKERGGFTIPGEDVVAGFGGGAHSFSTQHRFGGPDCTFLSCANSPHLSVPYDPNGTLQPRNNAPSTGGFHVDAHADWLGHYQDVTKQ